MIDKFGDTADKLEGQDANDPVKVANFLKGKSGIYVILNKQPGTSGAGYTGHVDTIVNGLCISSFYTRLKRGVLAIRIWIFKLNKMEIINKNILIVIFLFICCSISAQSEPVITGESTYYLTNNDGQSYAIYHYVDSQFGMRPFQIIVINYNYFEKVKSLIPKVFSKKPKQNGTDYYVIGLHDFDKKQIKNSDSKIIYLYIEQINNYREFNKLSPADNKDFLDKNCINYLNSDKELCSLMICE